MSGHDRYACQKWRCKNTDVPQPPHHGRRAVRQKCRIIADESTHHARHSEDLAIADLCRGALDFPATHPKNRMDELSDIPV